MGSVAQEIPEHPNPIHPSVAHLLTPEFKKVYNQYQGMPCLSLSHDIVY